MSNALNLSTLANVLDDGSDGQFLKSTGSGGVAFDTVAAGATVYSSASDLPLTGNTVGDMAYVSAATTAKVVNQATGSVSTEDATRLYIYSGTGWYSVAFITQNPTISTVQDAGGGSAPFTLATDGTTATVVTITANDPESVPLTYSYSVTSGSLNGCTITGADGTSARVAGTAYTDNVFTVTPHASQDATFTLTFTASDGINQATSANAFSLTFITTVTDSNYTSLLATATNGTSEFYSLSGALYDSITLDTSSESTSYQIFAFNNDGTKLFRISSTIIYQYTLTTGFDLSTGSYDNVSYTIPSNQGSNARAIQFNNDGTKMYVYTGSNTRISQYALTNGFDLSDVSYDNKLYNGTTGNSGFTFNNDGSKLFKATGTSKTIETYNLYPHFDISTASDANVSFSTASQTSGTAFQVQFNSNGTKMFVMDWVNSAGNNIYQYTLTQPYVVSSATYDNVSYNYNSQESSPNDFKFNNNGTKMYIGGFATDRIHQYSTAVHDNNNITDSSSNSHSITVNGDAHAGTFSPYRSGGYAMSLNGTDESFEPNHSSAGGLGTTWSVSYWANIPSTGATNGAPYIFDFDRLNSSGNGVALQANLSFKMFSLTLANLGSIINTATSLTCFDKWSYYVITHSSGTTTFYIDGSSVGSSTASAMANVSAANVQQLVIGADRYASSSYHTKMDVRDFHLKSEVHNGAVNNEPAVADSNTVILAAHRPYLAAQTGASTALAPVINNSVSTKPFSPYDYEEYDAADHGGSVYFGGGTREHLSTSLPAFGTQDFEVEFWIYGGALTSNTWYTLFSRDYNVNGSFRIYCSGGSGDLDEFIYIANGTEYNNTSAGKIKDNVWNHILLSRVSGTAKWFINGIADTSWSDSENMTSTATLYIGETGADETSNSSYPFVGYMSDIAIRIGGSGYRTSSFTPPTAPLSSSGTSLKIKGTDASIIDKSQGANLKLIGTTTGSTDQVRTGNWTNTKTMKFDGNSDYITIPNDEAYGFGTDDWTIETWLYCTKTGGFNAIFDTRVGTGTQTGNFGIGMYTTGRVQLFSGGIFYYPTDTLSFNTWQHFAVVKNSGTTTMYFNGTAASTTYSDSRDYGSSQPVQIGKDDTTSNYFGGYMQDFRITKGKARYTANFTPPSAPLEG